MEHDTEGVTLVNVFGLSIISFDSVTNFSSTLFGEAYRGFLITFRYVLLNGPVSNLLLCPDWMFLKTLLYSRALLYGRNHVVGIPSCVSLPF